MDMLYPKYLRRSEESHRIIRTRRRKEQFIMLDVYQHQIAKIVG